MKLGEFKRMVEGLSDDTDILIGYHVDVDEDDFIVSPIQRVQIDNKSNLALFYHSASIDDISQTAICVFYDSFP